MKRFKQARLQKGIKLLEAAKLLGVTQPTISSWESERKSPTIDMLIKIADLYGVSTDYLLGKDIEIGLSPNKIVSPNILPIYDSKPIWVHEHGWALVNAADNVLIFSNNEHLKISDVKDAVLAPGCFCENNVDSNAPISYKNLLSYETIWLEPISKDSELRKALRGRYQIKNGFAENECGNRFALSSYGATWLAFETNE